MNSHIRTISFAALLACALLALGMSVMYGADAKKPPIQKAVTWVSEDGKTQLFLTDTGQAKYILTVIAPAEMTVTYHTSRNSNEKIEKELKPLESSTKEVKRYEVSHAFSRTTIWMRLQFARNGKTVNALTRTFFDGITDVVPNDRFKDK